MSLSSKFGINPPSHPKPSDFVTDYRCVGIEIEQEYNRAEYQRIMDSMHLGKFPNGWNATRDGSLRNNGLEFVSDVLYPADIKKRLDAILPHVEKGSSSWRCAIHVHVDARDLEESQIIRIGELYSIMEPLIFKWEGNDRQASRFCIPWRTSVDAIQRTYSSVMSNNPSKAKYALQKFGKYTALNLMPLSSLGSIEFRHMQTVPDRQKILNYISMCLDIVEMGTTNINPLLELSTHGAEGFINQLFGGRLNFLINDPQDYDLLWDGIDTANAISVCHASNDSLPKSRAALDFDYADLVNQRAGG